MFIYIVCKELNRNQEKMNNMGYNRMFTILYVEHFRASVSNKSISHSQW